MKRTISFASIVFWSLQTGLIVLRFSLFKDIPWALVLAPTILCIAVWAALGVIFASMIYGVAKEMADEDR